jgi:hypothetical protein
MIFLVLICAAVMFVIMRIVHGHQGGPAWSGMMSCCGGAHAGDNAGALKRATWPGASPTTAFDEYRAETLRRLEQEQGEFQEFLERLRRAKDKAEFDQFMGERRVKAPNSGANVHAV